MAAIRSHKDLVAWQLSEQLKDHVYEITTRPEALRDRDFCADIRRSSRSAPANLAEAFGRYRPRDTARIVRIAIASLEETINHLGHASKQRYISEGETTTLITLAKRARGACCAWLAYLDSCPPDGPKRSPKPRSTPSNGTSEAERPDPGPDHERPNSEPER
jgi:four helix bundle protein